MSTDYAARCKAAATAQGLDVLTDALTGAGVPFAVEQTGGFCMAVTSSNDGGTMVAVEDGDWFTVVYPDSTWRTGPAEAATDERSTDLDGAVCRFVRHHLESMTRHQIDRIVTGIDRIGGTAADQLRAWNIAIDLEAGL